jgi:hypothetical protein
MVVWSDTYKRVIMISGYEKKKNGYKGNFELSCSLVKEKLTSENLGVPVKVE